MFGLGELINNNLIFYNLIDQITVFYSATSKHHSKTIQIYNILIICNILNVINKLTIVKLKCINLDS